MSISLDITTTGSDIAGDIFSLECTPTLNGFMGNIDFQWLLSMNNASTYIDTNSSVSRLVFSPLQHYHEGTVTCQVTVEGIVRTKSYSVTVNGKA